MRNYYFFGNEMLRFTPEYLAKMKSKILDIPIEQQAEFVDIVTYQRVKQGIQLVSASDVNNITNWNTTSIGNMAYIALYHPNDQQRATAKYILEFIKRKI